MSINSGIGADGELVLAEKTSKQINGLKHGDIVIVTYPNGLQCVKRIIGIGGDTVSIQDSIVFLNGEPIKERYINEKSFDDMREIEVPQNTVFVMGDNRNHSSDSREPFIGPVPNDKIVGHAISVIYPFEKIRSLS